MPSTMIKLTSLSHTIPALQHHLHQAKSQAGWPNLKLPAILGSVLGFAGDYLSPIFGHILLWALLFTLALVLISWWQYRVSLSGKWSARTLLTSLVSLVVILIIYMANVLVETFTVNQDRVDPIHRGLLITAVDGLADLQTSMMIQNGQIRQELETLNEEVVKQTDILHSIEKGTTKTGNSVTQVQQTMELSVALNLVDRAKQARDGSQQGQVQALESLLAKGYEFSNTEFSGINLKGANLQQIQLQSARMHFVDLSNADLQSANLQGSGMRFATLDNANMSGASLSDTFSPLISAKSTQFQRANLSQGYFLGSSFQNADFTGADLSGAAFAYTDLRGANFTNADLSNAFFIGAILDGADFTNTQFANTDFRSANSSLFILSPAQLAGICQHDLENRYKPLPLLEWNMTFMERYPSDRFSSGYEFEDIQVKNGVFRIESTNLPPCATPSSERGNFNTRWPGNLSLKLDRHYLSKAGRRQNVLERTNHQFELLSKHIKQERQH